MLKRAAIVLSILILASAGFAYHRYTVGVIEPGEIYPEALGRSQESVIDILGIPRQINDLENGRVHATWQGRDPFAWIYSVWFFDGVAVQVSMPNDLVELKIEDIMERVDSSASWQPSVIRANYETYNGWTTHDRTVVLYETPSAFELANDKSIFWSW